MLHAPAIHSTNRRVILYDLDQTLVQSEAPTREALYKTLFDKVQSENPQVYTDYDSFRHETIKLNARRNGNARGWQTLLSLPDEWTYQVYEAAAKPMAEAVVYSCKPDQHIVDMLEANRESGVSQFIFTQSTQTYCDIVLPHLGLDKVFSPDKVLHVNWMGNLLKTDEEVYKKMSEISGVRNADIRDLVDDKPRILRAAHKHAGFRGWLNSGEVIKLPKPYIFRHHTHIHETLTALAIH